MAYARGRTIASAGNLFGEYTVDSGAAAPTVGQPVMVRMQGVPTMPGYRDRPGKWNFARLPEWLRRLLTRGRPTPSDA